MVILRQTHEGRAALHGDSHQAIAKRWARYGAYFSCSGDLLTQRKVTNADYAKRDSRAGSMA